MKVRSWFPRLVLVACAVMPLATATAQGNPALALAKSLLSNADEDTSGTVSVNDTLTYQFVATNAGNVTLTNVTIVDPLPGLSELTCAPTTQPATLDVGTDMTCTATYVVTQADVDAGVINNTGTADSNQTPPVPDSETVRVPHLIPGRNINMVGGSPVVDRDPIDGTIIGVREGDPFLQRQNEPSIAVSARNPMHLLAGANDYRTVDFPDDLDQSVPGTQAGEGDIWLGVFKSFDGGQSWRSTLLPGFPQDTSSEGTQSPISDFEAGADPTVRAGTHGLFYYSGIAFNRGENALGAVFVARFIDLNNKEGASFPIREDPIKYIDTSVIDTGTSGQFVDKPWLAVDIPRPGFKTTTITVPEDSPDGQTISQTLPCGHAYLAYADFTGETKKNPRSKVLVSRSTDCGQTWGRPILINETFKISQGVTVAIDPNDGRVWIAWRQFGDENEPDQMVIAKQIMGGKGGKKFAFEKAVQVAELSPLSSNLSMPFDQPTLPVSGVDERFRSFRTNSYPTMAIDHTGRLYLAWPQRGAWGRDNDDPPPGDGVPDGTRIVITSSTDGVNWSPIVPVEPPPDPIDSAPVGHQIMPSLTYTAGKLVLIYYDFREDSFPEQYKKVITLARVMTCFANPPEGVDCDDLLLFDPETETPQFIEWMKSLPVADPIALDPLPVRHTVDVYLAEAPPVAAEAPPGANPVFTSSKVSSYMSAVVNTGTALELVPLQSNPPNFPMFVGGQLPFMGDYIDVASASQFVPDNPGGWKHNVEPSTSALVFHAAWTENRDVVPPPLVQAKDASGMLIFDQTTGNPVFERLDWANYVPPEKCIVGTAGMRNQNIYTSRLSMGLVIGSLGNSKPLLDTLGNPIERAFALFVENTALEEITNATFERSKKFFRLSIDAPVNVKTSFTPLSPIVNECEFDSVLKPCLDIEVQSLSAVGVTVFAKLTATPLNPLASITVNAVEMECPVGADCTVDTSLLTVKADGLLGSVILNPDPTNPPPVNVDLNLPDDPNDDAFLVIEETHDPEFVSFNCSPFTDITIFPNCLGGTGQVVTLITTWPQLVDSSTPALLNPALLNPALLNPALLNPALLNPALLNPALLNPALLNPALLNPALLNPALLNPALLNPALLNPALLNPALLNPALLNPALLNPALLNPALLNPALLNPALLNSAPGDDSSQQAVLQDIVFNTEILNTDFTDASLTDFTWKVKNAANTSSNFFFTLLTNLFATAPANSQVIIYRTYQAPLADGCALKESGIHYQILVNILNPSLLDPSSLDPAILTPDLLKSTFTLAPDDEVFITLRTIDIDPLVGQILPLVVQQAPDSEAEVEAWTVLSVDNTSPVFGQLVNMTARVGSYGGTPEGSVRFKDNTVVLGTVVLASGVAGLPGVNLSVGSHEIVATYLPDPGFKCGTGPDNEQLCDSQPVVVTVSKLATTTTLISS
ncbi:Ig-like domain repeat protein, partial [Acidobacteria bacterium AH-259-A15]|nr:Ig-like domain repeat protein [Acidobacteria bacterium AH-259-A15]